MTILKIMMVNYLPVVILIWLFVMKHTVLFTINIVIFLIILMLRLLGLQQRLKMILIKILMKFFELESGVPTYGYELAEAVKDGYLVDFLSVETELKFIEQGIAYDELSDEEKDEYEKTFITETGEIPEKIAPSALNNWVFNEDTIRKVLNILMQDGLKIDYGENLGKTIIFAKNHDHAEKILEIFNKEYPHLKDYAKVIDNKIKYAQSAIDEFSDPKNCRRLQSR